MKRLCFGIRKKTQYDVEEELMILVRGAPCRERKKNNQQKVDDGAIEVVNDT